MSKREIEQYDLTKPYKAIFHFSCTKKYPEGRICSWCEPVFLIFKNKRQFEFFNNDRPLLKDAFGNRHLIDNVDVALIQRVINDTERNVDIDLISLVVEGDKCHFEHANRNVPELDFDPDSPTYKEKK